MVDCELNKRGHDRYANKNYLDVAEARSSAGQKRGSKVLRCETHVDKSESRLRAQSLRMKILRLLAENS